MGTAGMLSVFFVLPQMGKVYDHYKAFEWRSGGITNVVPRGSGYCRPYCCLFSEPSGSTTVGAAVLKPQRLTPVENKKGF
jgi:hypothetical protein